jgi:predicted TIM-barrel fold metal-dependent hydrolase
MRDIHRAGFTLTSYPPTSPLSGRADWRPAQGPPGSDLALLRTQALDGFGSRYAVCNVLHGAVTLYTDDLRAALIRAINNWTRAELLDREPRLRASIVVSPENAEQAVEEIERLAPDPRFVQVLLLVMGESPLGRRNYWPIYAAAERHNLTVGIHAGSSYRHAPTQMGWTSYQMEDYAAQAPAFDNTQLSLIAEGVFTKFPRLRVVLIESGFTWLPTFLWRTNKIWRGVRAEVPWLDRQPEDYVRDQVRFTLQPADLPPDRAAALPARTSTSCAPSTSIPTASSSAC